ncbi:ATP-binding cassette domain-containing protein [Salinicoccus sp. Marseille-QA3877]
MSNNDIVMSIRDLSKRFGEGCDICREDRSSLDGNICLHCGTVHAVRDVSFDLYKGEILGIVGESGSGKSTLMKMLYFDQAQTSGDYFIESYENGAENVFNVSSQKKREIRNGQLGMVYQNPLHGLKINFSSMTNIAEKLIAGGSRNVAEMTGRGEMFLDKVRIPLSRKFEAPKNFSGGMQQRVQIAKALSNYPPILLLDEVTTGLDLSVQADVLELIKEIQREMGVSMIVVSHDLAIIRMLCDRTMVLLDGQVIENGITDQILEDPQHEYTQQLVYSIL